MVQESVGIYETTALLHTFLNILLLWPLSMKWRLGGCNALLDMVCLPHVCIISFVCLVDDGERTDKGTMPGKMTVGSKTDEYASTLRIQVPSSRHKKASGRCRKFSITHYEL